MALSARELLLIIRAQNQASAALRRVASDMRGLGRIQDLNIRRNQLAINQANAIRQRLGAEARLADITSGRRRIQAEQERMRIFAREARLQDAVRTATSRRALVQRDIMSKLATGATLETRSVAKLQTQYDALTRSIENNQRHLRMIPAAFDAWDGRMKNNAARASQLQGELRTLAQRMVVNQEKMRLLDREIASARWDKAVFGARAFAHAGRIAQLVGLGAGASLGFLANMAADFSERATLVATQTGKVGTGFQQITENAEVLSSRILTTMADSTSSMEELEAAAYDIFSSLTLPDGGRGLKIGTNMLKQMSDAAIAGMTDVETVTEGVVATLGAFEEIPRTSGGVDKILNRMFAAVRFGRMTFAEFASTLGTTAPAARAAGQSLDTMAGTIAFLSRPLGVNKAAVGFARLTEILGRKAFVDGLKKANVEITNSRGEMDQLPEIIDKVTRKFPELTKGGVKLVQFFKKMSGTEGTIQARRAFVFLAQQLDQYRTVLGQTVNDNNEFDRSLKAMSETAGVQWKQAMNTLRTLGIEIGLAVIPTLIKILEPIEDLVHWFQQLDPEVKEQIGSWAAWGAVVLLVGGTLALIVGSIGSMLATLARMQILFRSSLIVIVAVSAAIVALTGDFDALGDIARNTMDFFTGSWTGMATGAALAAVAVVRLASAYRSLAAVTATTTAAQAAGVLGPQGFFPMLIRSPGNIRAAGSAMKEAGKGANIAGKAFKGAAAGFALLPGPLKLAAAGVALFGVGALIYSRHAQRAADASADLAEEIQRIADNVEVATFAAQRFSNVTTFAADAQRAALDIKDINAQIKELRKQMKQTSGAERAGIGRQVQRLLLDRADAYKVLHTNAAQANASLSRFNQFLSAQGVISAEVGRKQSEINSELAKIAAIQKEIRDLGIDEDNIPAAFVARIEQARGRISELRQQIGGLESGSKQASTIMLQSFSTIVRDLQNMGKLPRKITGDMVKDVLALQVKLGRALSVKEMKLTFDALINPESMRKLPGQIQSFLRTQRRNRVEVTADVALNRQKLTQMERRLHDPTLEMEATTNVEKAQRQIKSFMGWFQGNKNLPPFQVSVTPGGFELGQQLAAGVSSGFSSVDITKSITVHINAVRNNVARNEGIESPSKRWAKEIGLPIGQGVLVGMIKGFADIPSEIKRGSKKWKKEMARAWKEIMETAGQTLLDKYNEFRDTLRDTIFDPVGELNELRLEWDLPLDVKELTQDLKTQTGELRDYQKDWAKLIKRGAPLELLLQLSELGEEGQAIVESLAGANKKDLKAYIKAWNQAQKTLDKAAKQQLRTQVKRWRQMGKAMAFGIIAGLKDEQERLKNFFERMFRQMFRDGQRANKSRSPSKLWAEEGRNIIAGLEQGLNTGRGIAVPQPAIGGGMRRGRAVRTSGAAPINMTVNANRDENLMTTLERMRFRMRNRT